VRFKHFLDTLAYPCWDETDNPAYRFFLDGNAPATLAVHTIDRAIVEQEK
jgi:hypothetical protein